MKIHEIEYWVLNIIDQVKKGQPVEDVRVELKANWPTPEKAARRIAGHANAARGNPILWVIGLDEEKGVVGVKKEELSSFLSQVRSYFDGDIFPTPTDLVMAVDGSAIAVLYLETERAPFVVKNPEYGKPNGGPIERETPWREGTSVRSATRLDLIKILSPIQALPSIEVISGQVAGNKNRDSDKVTWSVSLTLYIIPADENRLVIPFHYCNVSVNFSKDLGRIGFGEIRLHPPSTGFGAQAPRLLSKTIVSTPDELIGDGPGKCYLNASVQTEGPAKQLNENAQVALSLLPVNAEYPVVVEAELRHDTSESDDSRLLSRWLF